MSVGAEVAEAADGSRLDPAMQAMLRRILAEHQRELEDWIVQHHERLEAAVLGACAEAEPVTEPQPTYFGMNQSPEQGRGPQEHAKLDVFSSTPETPSPSHTRTEGTSVQEGHGPQTPYSGSALAAGRNSHVAKSIVKLTRENSVGIDQHTLRWKLHKLLKGPMGLFLGALILISTAITFFDLQVHGDGSEGQHLIVFDLAGHLFTVAFLLELLARIYVYRLDFFMSLFNWVDTAVIILTCLDSWVLAYVDSGIVNIAFLRMVRFVRIARTLRVMRTLSLFKNLRVLMNAIFVSMPSLLWSMVVLCVFMVSASLFLCQLLQDFLKDKTNDPDTRKWVQDNYGTSVKALYTVFEITLSGCWPNGARRLIEEVSWWYALFFVCYVTAVVFAMIRIISALFLKDTLSCTANDDELICAEKEKEMASVKFKLSALFNQADVTKDGYLDLTEFESMLEHPNVKVWLTALGVDARSAFDLFTLLDHGNGFVSLNEFLDGISRLRGTAKSQDLCVLMDNTKRILEQHVRMVELLNSRTDSRRLSRHSQQPVDSTRLSQQHTDSTRLSQQPVGLCAAAVQ